MLHQLLPVVGLECFDDTSVHRLDVGCRVGRKEVKYVILQLEISLAVACSVIHQGPVFRKVVKFNTVFRITTC